jgi:PKD domain
MKRLIIPLVLILVVTAGCLYTPPAAKVPPTAYIDSVSPINTVCGQSVTFTGHGIDPDGTIGAYSWRSSRDGDLSTAPSFSTTTLSPGSHTIWFKVQDNDGQWSPEVLATVIVVASGAGRPVINSFNANPGIISVGGTSTLSWDVTGCTTVSIEPGIGNVGLNGTRVVLPGKTTMYTLTATNEVGAVAATTQVVVGEPSLTSLELYSIASEDGQVRRDGYVGQEPDVGDTKSGVSIQAFISFDISMVPKGATIKSAVLDLTASQLTGDPFNLLGNLKLFQCQYSTLSAKDFVIGPALGSLQTFSMAPSRPVSSTTLNNAIQSQVDAGSNRFQLRFQFDKPQAYNNQPDYLSLGEGRSKLTIQYQY